MERPAWKACAIVFACVAALTVAIAWVARKRDSKQQMRFIVFQHGECEHPGVFRRFFEEDGIAWDVVELDKGNPIPALEPYDAMIVMGSDGSCATAHGRVS